ncbi:hypothetical protein EDB82DRAFT_544781 [Fusarium venenatum]|uniref:uncharacterized protein n=1 Tax=Fusarium venenatum TaxID=56646 RepID=UPI001E0BDD5D|nr:hypothetical protein EDB82DRAFT_544781 [Fusarium venenatum]
MSFAQPTKKSFSSTVDFSDQSYEMPYFVDVDAPAMKASGVTRKPIASQPEASTPRSIAPTYELKDPKRKTTQENVDPATPKGAEHGPPLPPRTHSFKPNPAAFLQSFKFPSIQHFKIEPRATDSSAWLDKDPLFSNWKSSKHTLLWLRGSEGCGKSTLMNHALHTQLQMEPSAMHLTYSFSICGSEIPRTRLGLLKSILHQLIPQAPEAFDDIKTRFQRIQDALPSKQQVAWSAQELFEDLTKTIAKILKTRSVCMYVDGIDRSEGETAAKFVQDFSKLLERSQPKPSTKEPTVTHGLKIIFSSTIFPAKEPFPQSYINVDEKNGPSLRQFLKEQLSTTDSNTRQLILSKSGSSFISARLIIQHVKLFGPMQSSLVQQPSPTPAPISFLLGGYFQNMAQQGNKSLASLLSWVCLTTRPLTLAELRVALSLDMIHKLESFKYLLQAEPFSRYSSDESFQSWIKATSWGLLETVTLRGQKVVKGLAILSYGSQPPESPNSPLQISHKSLATNLLRYLVVLTKEPKLPNGDDKDPTFELLGYAGANWSNHISAAGLVKPDASKILKLLQWPSDSVMNVLVKWDQENHAVSELKGTLWAHIFAVYGHASLLSVAIKKRTPLHHAALHGHLAASKQLLKSGAKGDARAANGQTALHYAVLQGHQSLVSATNHLAQTPLLLAVIQRRADVKALDRFKSSALHHALLLDSGHTPLHLAISENRPAIIKLLLERGCRVDIPDMSGRTPLHMTAASGNKSCAQELLKRKTALVYAVEGHKSDVNARNKQGFNILMLAVRVNQEKIAKLLLDADPDLDVLSSEGHTVIFYAVYRGKAVSLLSEKEQLKKQVVWNAEWIACKEKFMAEHGKKKGDAKLKTKSKAGSKKTAAPPSAPIPHKKQVRKPVDAKLEDVSKASTDSKMPAPKPNTPVAGSKESVRPNPKPTTKPNPKAVPKVDHKADPRPDSKAHQNPDPKVSYKVDHKPDTKPGSTATSQSHTAANAYSPFNSSGPVISPPLPQRPAAAQNNSISMPTQTHQKQQNSAFMPFQPPQSTVGTSVHTSFNTGSASPTGHQRLPTNHRSSWDMYTALSASSPESAQTTPIVTKNPYTSYSGASQQPPRGDSFRPFQPFQSNVSPGSPSNATPQSRGQSNDRYSLPSQSSYAQGQNSSGKQATQQGTVQGYQPFSINPQTPSMVPSHPQATGRKPVNSSINPITSLSIGRKPVGGQPVTGAPRKSSPPNQMQASQSLVGIVQTTHGKSQAQSEAPGKQSITPVASQSSIAAQNSALGHSAIASARPALAVAQKPVAQAATSSKPITIQQPTSAQKPAQPSTQQQPAAIQKPSIAAKPSISQQPTVAQKPVPPSTVTTAPKPSTQQQPTSQKSTTSQQPPPAQKPAPPQKHAAGPTAAKPSTLQQPTMTQRPSPPQKPSPAQKPAPTQQATPNEKKLAPSGPATAPGKPALKPAPPSAYPSGYSSQTQSTKSQDTKKVAAAAGAGVLAGAAGGYFLSNYSFSYTENYYLDTQGEPSEHSEEYSEAEESEDGGKSDDESEDNDSISFILSDDDDLDLDEVDSDEDEIEDDVQSLDFDQDESDSPDVATDFTDDDNAGDISDIDNDDDDDDEDASDEETGLGDMQAESDNAGQDVDSNEDIGNEPEHLQAHYQQQMQYGHFQHQAVDETDSEDEQQQQNHFQQQTFQQPDSDDEEQPVQYVNHQQQDEMQQNHYYGQHQHQAQSTFDEDSDDQVDVDSDNEVDEQTGNNEGGNGYGQQNHGVYEGAGYDSDY